MIVLIKPRENVQDLRNKVDNFLIEKSLNVKEAKTKLVKSTQGFDFLGWSNAKAKNNKTASDWSKNNDLKMITKIKKKMCGKK